MKWPKAPLGRSPPQSPPFWSGDIYFPSASYLNRMVLIIDGEVVADNDPRAIAKRSGGGGATPARPQPQQRANVRPALPGPRVITHGFFQASHVDRMRHTRRGR